MRAAQRFALVKVEKSTTWWGILQRLLNFYTTHKNYPLLYIIRQWQLVHKVSEEALRSDGKRVDHSSDLMAHL